MKVLAHSAQLRKGIPEQTYQEHITGYFGVRIPIFMKC